MSLAELEKEITELSEKEQNRLMAMLVAGRMKRDGEWEEVSRLLDDDNPKHWIAWEDAKKELERLDDADGS